MLKTIALISIISFALLQAVSGDSKLYKANDGKEYLIETEAKYNWYQAWHECARKNLQLVAIETEEKNNAIIDVLKKVVGKPLNLWLGGNDEFSSGRDYNRPFYWLATGKQFSFTSWSPNNPDNDRKREHCVHFWEKKPYQWNDIDCTTQMGFICEENRYAETYNKEVTQKCDAFKHSSLSIAHEYDQVFKQQIMEINHKIQSSNQVADDWKVEMQQLQNTTLVAVQKVLDDQHFMVKQLTEKMLHQVHNMNVELEKSSSDISAKFSEKLSVKENEINKIC
uniref:Putative lectin alpha-subunit n=1 Tax=Lucilia sericata TaxID=13632 RepID=D9J144_LUCSE|nr:putative lectin alpha-subunit [Lucilia sericata]